jgi:hypothetical protein
MISFLAARETAESFIDVEMRSRFPHDILIVEAAIEDRGDVWVFPYDGRGYVERGDLSEAMAGNLPIIVNKETGVVAFED